MNFEGVVLIYNLWSFHISSNYTRDRYLFSLFMVFEGLIFFLYFPAENDFALEKARSRRYPHKRLGTWTTLTT